MIATKPIKQGEELINNYGPLSISELLRRFGFIEEQPNPHNGCEIPCAMLVGHCQEQMRLTSPKPSSSEVARSKALLQHKLEFCHKHGLVPKDGWFKADALGQPQDEMIEVARLMLLTATDFEAFEQQVDRWRCPLTRPLTQITSICHQVPHIIRAVATERLAALTEPCAVNSDQASTQQVHCFRRTAAQKVLLTERRALLGLQLWVDKHDSTSLINCSKKVWMHLR